MELFVSDIDTSEFSHTDGKGKLNAHNMCVATTFRQSLDSAEFLNGHFCRRKMKILLKLSILCSKESHQHTLPSQETPPTLLWKFSLVCVGVGAAHSSGAGVKWWWRGKL